MRSLFFFSNRQAPVISHLHLENMCQTKEKQAKGKNQRLSPATNPRVIHPADPTKPEQTAVVRICYHGQTCTTSSIRNGTHPVRRPTTALRGASLSSNHPGFILQSRYCQVKIRPSASIQQKVQRKSWTSHHHLYLLRKVAQLSTCQWRSSAAPGSTSGGDPNPGVRLLTGPLGTHVRGCPATRDWRSLRSKESLAFASPHALPRQWGITSAPTLTATHTAASRWRLPSWRVASNGWRDTTTPQQNWTLSSFCVLKNLTFKANSNEHHNTFLLISTSKRFEEVSVFFFLFCYFCINVAECHDSKLATIIVHTFKARAHLRYFPNLMSLFGFQIDL